VIVERDTFGPRLRDERIRQGITLEAIARATKIKQSLLAALERNDVSQWPVGIFRRAFLREYAAAIGLPPEPLVAEFVRLFPEPGAAPLEATIPKSENEGGLRLTLAPEPGWQIKSAVSQLLAAVADTGAILLIAVPAAFMTGANPWMTSALTALGYHALATACVGRSPVSWLLTRGRSSRVIGRLPHRSVETGRVEPVEPVELDGRDRLHIVSRRSPSPLRLTEQDESVQSPAPKVRAQSNS
jgi:transcriptional regulator with XRE-family HTH domain